MICGCRKSCTQIQHKIIKYEIPLLKFSPNAGCHLEEVRKFGCIAYAKLSKLDAKLSKVAIKTVIVEHTPTEYILWHPNMRKFLESRHGKPNEKSVSRDVYKVSEDKIFPI